MKKKICLGLASLLLGLLCVVTPVYADGGSNKNTKCEHSILGLRPWYAGLEMDQNCTIISPKEDGLTVFVWKIVLNVLADVFLVAGYLAIGFVIYGGIMYIMSAGEPGKVARGKQILTSAAIGLIITILANVIVNIVIGVLGEATK